MAGVNFREMMLLITAENRASSALKSVGRDLTSLTNLQKAHVAQQRLATRATQLENQQLAAQNKLRSLTTGSNALALQKQRLALTDKQVKLERDLGTNLKAQALWQDKIAAAQRRSSGNTLGVRNLQLQLERLRNTQKTLLEQSDALAIANQKLAVSERELATSTAAANRELALIGTRLAAVRAQQAALRKEVAAMRWDPLIKGGSIMTHLARPMQYAGIAIGASFGYAASQAAKFNTQASLAATQVSNKFGKGAATVQAASAQIQKGILGILASRVSTGSPADQNTAAYNIFSSMTLKGNQKQQVQQGLAILKEVNKAAIGGQTDLPSVTNAAITVLNDFGKTGNQVKDLPKLLDRMFASVRYGRMNFAEFVATLNQTAPAFKAAGLSFDDLAASEAALTRDMPSSRMAGTALARLVQMLSRKDFIDGMAKAGAAITHIGPGGNTVLDPLITVMDKIDKKFPNLKKGGTELTNFYKTITALGSGKAGTMGTIQGNRAMQLLLLDLKNYHVVAPQVIGDNNEFTKSFKALQSTPQVQWKEFINALHAMVITIGEQVIPALSKLGKPLMQALKWFNSLSDSTKKMFAQWGTYTAVGLLLGSTLLYILGTVVKLVGTLGKMRVLMAGLFLGFVGYVLITDALAGKIHSLNDALYSLVGIFTNHGIWGWIGYFAVASYGVIRLTSALKGLRGAMALNAVAGATGGAGGLLGSLGRAGSYAKTGFQVSRLEGAGLGAASLAGLGTAATSLSVALPIAAGAIAIGAGGLYLWEQHLKRVREHAQAIAAEMQRINNITNRESASGKALSGLGGNVEGVLKARLVLGTAQSNLRSDRKSGASKGAIKSDILDVVDAQQSLFAANYKTNKSYGSLNKMLRDHASLLANIGQKQKEARNAPFLGLVEGGLSGVHKMTQHIHDLNNEIRFLEQNSTRSGRIITASFGAALTSLQKIGPAIGIGKISSAARADLLRLSLKQGQFPTISQIKAVIHAEVDPSSLRKASTDIRNAITAGQRARAALKPSVKPHENAILNALAPAGFIDMMKNLPKVKSDANKIHHTIVSIFAKHVKEPIDLGPISPKAAVLGAQIDQGIARGVTDNVGLIDDAVVAAVNSGIAAARSTKGINAHSPSKKARDLVGKPIVEGIAVGILENQGFLQRPVALMIDSIFSTMTARTAQNIALFSSTAFSNRESAITASTNPLKVQRAQHAVTLAQAALGRKKGNTPANQQRLNIAKSALGKLQARPLSMADLQKDITSNLSDLRSFNSSIGRLQARKVPLDMLDSLEQLGTGGVKELKLLANSSVTELNKYIAAFQKAHSATTIISHVTTNDVLTSVRSQATLYTQFNKNLRELTKRNAPKDLVDQLRSAGVGSEAELVAINKMTDKQLKQFVSLWKKYEGQTKIATKNTTADIKAAAVQMQNTIFTSLLSTFTSMKSQEQSAFGSLFGGSTLSNMIGSNSGLGSSLSSMFGSPFSGLGTPNNQALDNINAKLNWGAKFNQKDLQTALQIQVNDFKGWSDDIQSLVKKGVPSDLVSQLEALGPASKSQLDILNAETADQLKQYTDLWEQGQKDITDATTKLQIAIDPTTVIDDLSAQVAAFNNWQADIQKLRDEGLPEQLIQQLEALGPGADSALKALIAATQPQLDTFVSLWSEAQASINTAAALDFNAQLADWYAQGIDVGNAIIQGTLDVTPSVVKAFQALAQKISAGYKSNLDLPGVTDGSFGGDTGLNASLYQPLPAATQAILAQIAAGNKYAGQVAKNSFASGGTVGGMFNGTDNQVIAAMPGEHILTRNDVSEIKSRLGGSGGSGDTYNIEIHANQDESMMTTLNRMAFRIKSSKGRSVRTTP